jgi:endogenous inhibitor of DNA gyrase (YacG/DUF329 family)
VTAEPARIVTCPTCRQRQRWSASNPYRPFCSERCKLIDLGEWASERHRIAGDPVPSHEEDESRRP